MPQTNNYEPLSHAPLVVILSNELDTNPLGVVSN
jgi:hypothetical protein